MSLLVIACYHCEVAGERTDSVDYQVRFFATDDEGEVVRRLQAQPPNSYKNSSGETVSWIFDETVAIQYDPELKDGAEVIGFITGKPKERT